jgi:hypothetical protein
MPCGSSGLWLVGLALPVRHRESQWLSQAGSSGRRLLQESWEERFLEGGFQGRISGSCIGDDPLQVHPLALQGLCEACEGRLQEADCYLGELLDAVDPGIQLGLKALSPGLIGADKAANIPVSIDVPEIEAGKGLAGQVPDCRFADQDALGRLWKVAVERA